MTGHAKAILAASVWVAAVAASGPSPKSVVEAKFAAANRHSAGEVAAFYDDNANLTASDFCRPRRGKAEVMRTYEAIFAAVPDIRVEVIEYVIDGDHVAVRAVLRSRAPGRSFDLALMNFFTVKNGKIVRDDGVFDNGGRPCHR